MSKVTIYRFHVYDIGNDEYQKSRRWGTLEAITKLCGDPIMDTATEVDAAVLGREIAGLTERDFDPCRRTGFPRSVGM